MGVKVFIFGLLMVVGGLVSIGLGYSVSRRDGMLASWPSVMGTIVHSSLIRTTQARLRVPATRGGARPEPTYRQDDVWALSVEYRYLIGGNSYTGYDATSSLLVEDIAQGQDTASQRLRELAAQLPAGSKHAVHYNPEDPEQSYLVYIDDPGKARLYRIGGLCAVAGLLVALGGRFL